MPTKKQTVKKQSSVEKLSVGRPSKMTPEMITKLKAAFANSFTVDEACWYAGINKQTYYNWGEKHPELLDEMDAAKKAPNMKAKQVVIGSVNAGDVESAKWWLKNKASDEFGGRPAELNLGLHFHQHTGEKKEDYGF
jgi:hypothetical protein